MPSPAAGVLTQILAEEGDTVQTGARVAVIEESGASVPDASQPPVAEVAAVDDTPVLAPESPSPVPTTPPAPPESVSSGVVMSPVVRRILADGEVEPSSIRGSGAGGAITRRDAERAVANGPTDELVVPLSNARRRMGEHMSVSAQSVPHGFVAIEADGEIFGELETLGRVTRDGVHITDEMLVGLAAVRALGEYEFLNATFAGDELVVHRTVNLGFVRVADNDGMLVPVVHAAAGLTLRALARRVSEVGERVVARRLTADDLMGGTFTLSGAPSEHALWSVPILIQPQVATLSVGVVRQVPVVVSQNGTATVEVGRRLILGLSFDHRVCEPTAAAGYLERVAELLAGLDLESEH
jgi:pyruvate/2-oxoglutarate dehydrogenase complex dihydrolipoamide acyltransferase (E2) component